MTQTTIFTTGTIRSLLLLAALRYLRQQTQRLLVDQLEYPLVYATDTTVLLARLTGYGLTLLAR
jgi:hypothetical protein